MSGAEARGAILSSLKGSPAAVATVIVVILFLRHIDATDTRTAEALHQMSSHLESLSKEFTIRNQMAADAIKDITRNTDAITRITTVIDRLVEEVARLPGRGG